jgi:hypothetical protein
MLIRLKPPQWEVFNSESRFRILIAGRRFGKTYLALVELCQAAWGPGRLVCYVAPTCKQAKRIVWESLKKMTRLYRVSKPNETDLRIELRAGGTICVRGADNYDSLRGEGFDFVVLDEYAAMNPAAWTEVLRPALADRRGGALFIGTPRGYNHLYHLYQEAQDRRHWSTFQFTTEEGGNVSPEELRSATQELDERTYQQEFQASFQNLTVGRAYYSFDRAVHVDEVEYVRGIPLCWSLDFNINPMCSVIGQVEEDSEATQSNWFTGAREQEEQPVRTVRVIDEIVLANAHTEAACEAFLERTAPWIKRADQPVRVDIYGDATGSARRSSASRTDWQLVRDFFARHSDCFRAIFHTNTANPLVRDRVNCVNARLRNQAGESRLLVHRRCKHLIEDLERVHWKNDAHGNGCNEIDKSDPARTHASDALGYMLASQFPLQGKFGFFRERLL